MKKTGKQLLLALAILLQLIAVSSFAAPVNDNMASAIDLSSSINGSCSSSGLYTTTGGTADLSKGSCWSGGPYANVWFKFTATSTKFINIKINVGATGESMRYPMVALWDASGTTQLQCQNQQGYGNGAVSLSMSYYGLTPGTTYYISVDNYRPWAAAGSFDICLSDVVDYDYPQGAIDMTTKINDGCSSGGTYSNQFATADGSKGSCWSGGPYNNRWFKFTANSRRFINIQVRVNGAGETMRYPMVTLWDGSRTVQLQCQNQQGYGNGTSNLSMSYYGLNPGATYYIEVDNYTPWGATGTFDLCLTDKVDYDYPQGAVDLTSSINTGCSTAGIYSNQYATQDGSKGSCWSGGPYNNRWFKFVASATGFINISVQVGSAGETMRYPMVALWDATQSTQLQCQNQQGYGNGSNSLSVSYQGLTPGATYYIEVDNYTPWGAKGTFDICLSDVPDYDYPEGAVDLTANFNHCSAIGAYSNTLATADGPKGSCWSGGPYNNRWFKFTATATGFVNIRIKVSRPGETMRYAMVALWDASRTTQLQCQNQQGYGNGASDLSVSYNALTPGATYYIEVDNYTPWGSAGTFGICISDQYDYDYPIGAVDLTGSMNGCSVNGLYSNQFATADGAKGSCWSGGPYNNRWFKFVATATGFINVQVKVSGSGETMRYPMVAIWDASRTTQLQCQNQQGYGNGAADLSVSSNGLTPGATYYIEVDNYTPWGSTGTFDVCIADQPDYDFPEGAIELTNLNNYCSSNGTYSNTTATADGSKPSCWSGGPYANRWFRFQAVNSNVTINVVVNGTGQTMRYPMVALYDANHTTVLACKNQSGYGSGATNATLTYSSLTVGNWYYIAVDNYTPWGNRGTFDLCINNALATQYYSIASGNWTNPNTWSTVSFTGPVAGTIPGIGSVVNIRDQAVTVTSSQECAEVNLTVAGANTSLLVDNGTLTIHGMFQQTNTAVGYDLSTVIQNAGKLNVLDNAAFASTSGSGNFSLTINSGTQMTVGQDMSWNSSSSSGQSLLMTLNGNGSLSIGRDLSLTGSNAGKVEQYLNNTATVSVARDLVFAAPAAGLVTLQANNTAVLNLKRNLVRSIGAYGKLYFASGAKLVLNGTGTSQTLPGSAGSGGDGFTLTNLTVNNSSGYANAIQLGGPVLITGALSLQTGKLQTSAANLLTLAPTATTTAGSASSISYIVGPLKVQKNSAGSSVLNFPIGKGADARPVVLTVNHANTNLYSYTAELMNASADSLNYSLPGTVDLVSSVHYWVISRADEFDVNQPSDGLSGNQYVDLHFGENDVVTKALGLTIVKNTASGPTNWSDIGGNVTVTGKIGSNLVGYVSSTSTPSAFTSFSTFTLGNRLGFFNTLPIKLLAFTATPSGKEVKLDWKVDLSTTNQSFVVERSGDGLNYQRLSSIPNSGLANYSTVDEHPLPGASYYRLKMVDDDQHYQYSKAVKVLFGAITTSVWKVYPNPARTGAMLTIASSGASSQKLVSVELFDLSGRKLYSQDGMNTIHLNHLPPAGLLLVIVRDKQSYSILHQEKIVVY